MSNFIDTIQAGPQSILLGATSFDAALSYPRWFGERAVTAIIGSQGAYQILEQMAREKPKNKNIVIFLSDGQPCSLDNFNYSNICDKMENELGATIFGIGYTKRVTGVFGNDKLRTIRDVISSQVKESDRYTMPEDAYNYYMDDDAQGHYFYRSSNISKIFENIFKTLMGDEKPKIIENPWKEKIEDLENNPVTSEDDCWMSLEHDGVCAFYVGDDDKIKERLKSENKSIVDANRKISIIIKDENGDKKDETTYREKTLSELGRLGIIGQIDGWIYINLSYFAANEEIEIIVGPENNSEET